MEQAIATTKQQNVEGSISNQIQLTSLPERDEIFNEWHCRQKSGNMREAQLDLQKHC